jgi:hypothetical protein
VFAAGIIVAFHVYLFVQNARGVCGVYADYFPASHYSLLWGCAHWPSPPSPDTRSF